MKVLGTGVIEQFGKRHADARSACSAWLEEVRAAQWEKPADIKQRFRSASIVNGKTVIFNIKGNNYRIAIDVAFNTKTVLIIFAGTHQEYDRQTF